MKIIAMQKEARMTPRHLIQRRTELGWSQSQLAQALGVHRSTVHRWEQGTRGIPRMADKLVTMLGLRHGETTEQSRKTQPRARAKNR